MHGGIRIYAAVCSIPSTYSTPHNALQCRKCSKNKEKVSGMYIQSQRVVALEEKDAELDGKRMEQ